MLDLCMMVSWVLFMNKLSPEERARILQLLCEGISIRAVTRLTGVSKNTVSKLLYDAGSALSAYQDKVFRNLKCKRVQVGEIWSFSHATQKNVAAAKAAPEGACDVWTWTAIDHDSKLVFSVLVGGRGLDYAGEFMADIRSRLDTRVQLTTEGHHVYLQAVREAFKREVDYSMMVKLYGGSGSSSDGHYGPAQVRDIMKSRSTGNPDMAHFSMSHVERQNLTMRVHMRRFTRLTNAISKKLEAHVNAVSLHFAYYNFVRIHQTLRISPAMAAGITDKLWEMADLVAIVEAAEKAPGKRGPYKSKGAA